MLPKATLLFFLVITSTLWGKECTFEMQQTQKFKGKVASIQKFNQINKPTPRMQFILIANDEEYTVELGPEWYVNQQGFFLIQGEEIEINGCLIEKEGKKIILPSQVKKGHNLLKLRSEDGKPLW